MANEAVIIELLGKVPGTPVRYTVGAATAIPKGTLLKITDPRTVEATSADNNPFAGIAAEEYDTVSGSTSMSVYTSGIFDLLTTNAAANVAAGERVSIADANTISKVDATDLLFSDVGVALETAPNNVATVIAVKLGGF